MTEKIEFDLVQNIKDCGQALIDNAEKIANDYKYTKGMTITCYVDRFEDCPYINVDTNFVPESFIERFK